MMRHWVDYLNVFPIPYEQYVEEMLDIYSLPYTSKNTVKVCNELTAIVEERAVYKDIKLFKRSGSYYKPSEMIAIPQRLKPQFLGLMHKDIKQPDRKEVTINPMNAIKLMSIMESFLSNQLILGKSYRAGITTCSLEKRKDAMFLCIDYSTDELKKTYLDKCNCKITASVIRTISQKCDYWLYD